MSRPLTVLAGVFTMAWLMSLNGWAQSPTLPSGGVTNAADYSREFAPGTIVTIWGTNLAPRPGAASAIPLPVALQGASVEVIDGSRTLNAPLFYVSSGQINAQLPFDLTGTTVQVRVRNAAGVSGNDTITVLPRAPRLFTKTMDGKGEAILLHADYSVVSAASPVKPGETVILYLTGLGAVDPSVAAGAAGGDGSDAAPLNLLTEGVSVTIDGRPASVVFSGLAPYFAGLYQVNFQAPTEMLGGTGALLVNSGGRASQGSVTMALAANWQAIGGGSIGTAGGTVTAGGLSVSAAAGALPSNSPLSILQKPSPSGVMDGTRISEVFSISGLPAAVSYRLSLTLNLSGSALLGGDSYIAVKDLAGGGTTFLDATVQGNRVTANMSPLFGEASSTGGFQTAADLPRSNDVSNATLMVWAFSGYKWVKSDSGRFILRYPNGVFTLAQMQDLVKGLDDDDRQLTNGLGLSWAARTNWPLVVSLYEFTGTSVDHWAEEGSAWEGRQNQGLNLNSLRLTTPESFAEMKVSAGHELFHVLQNLYDPRPGTALVSGPSPWLWLEEASATWFENALNTDYKFIPSTVVKDNYSFLVKHGLEYPPGDNLEVSRHGYGASMFLRQLASGTTNPTLIGNAIKMMVVKGNARSSKYTPVEALRSLVSDLGASWRQFVKNFMSASIYDVATNFPSVGQVTNLRDISDRTTHAKFSKETDSSIVSSWSAPDLSAHLFNVKFDTSYAWPANTTFKVTLTDTSGQAEAIVYRYGSKGTTWTQVGGATAGAPYQFQNVENLAKGGDSFVIMVANGRNVLPFDASTPLTLQVEVQPQPSARLAMFQKMMHSWGFIDSSVLKNSAGYFERFDVGTDEALWPWNPPCLFKWAGASFSWDCTYVGLAPSKGQQHSTGSGTVNQLGTILLKAQGEYSSTDYTGGNPQSASWSIQNAPLESVSNTNSMVFFRSSPMGQYVVSGTFNGRALPPNDTPAMTLYFCAMDIRCK